MIVSESSHGLVQPMLGAYRGRRFALRAFWGRDYSRLTVAGWWRWVVAREPWSPLGATYGWLSRTRGVRQRPSDGVGAWWHVSDRR